MNRTRIKIDENRCTGCGACVAGCHGGALQIIDGKARITNEDYCDGLGICIGTCPVGAIELEECEVEPQKEMSCCNVSFEVQQFPIQLRLVNPNASFLKNSDLVLAADCTAFVYSNFHLQFMKNNSIVIACPKLDNAAEYYVEKLTSMIDNSFINTLTVILMEVPCCGGLLHIAKQAQVNAIRKIPIKKVVIGTKGNLQSEEWI
ncbi:MAG: 4Fe-4S binding protein [Bacteroidetes bacterium]|nr:4Fe-4S binding protein [Bacteroidota bacterium]